MKRVLTVDELSLAAEAREGVLNSFVHSGVSEHLKTAQDLALEVRLHNRTRSSLHDMTADRDGKAVEVVRLRKFEEEVIGLRADLVGAQSSIQTLEVLKEGYQNKTDRQTEAISVLERDLNAAQEAAAEQEKSAKTNGGRVEAALLLLDDMNAGVHFTKAMRAKLVDALTGVGEVAAAA